MMMQIQPNVKCATVTIDVTPHHWCASSAQVAEAVSWLARHKLAFKSITVTRQHVTCELVLPHEDWHAKRVYEITDRLRAEVTNACR